MRISPHEYAFGPVILGNNCTRFRLWAPAQNEVSVVVDGTEAPMRAAGGWHEVEIECGAGTSYSFKLADGTVIPDPASRAQVEDVHSPSIVVDPGAYNWRNTQWLGRPWEQTVLYELHTGLFGGFTGVKRELPRLAALGVTAVELMPVNDFPGQRNWGYDGVLPYAPDRAYGSPDDLKELIDAAHDHGLMMFLDVVYNHFGPDGNYLPISAPQFFRDDVVTPWGPAIDFRRSEVRRFFTDNALYWLHDYRFDGLRFDAVHAITEADWLDEMAAEVRTSIPSGRHVHLVLEHDGNIADHLRRDFDAQWNDDGHHVLHALLTGENEGYYGDYADKPAHRLARSLSEGFIYQGEGSAHRGGQPRGTPSKDLPPSAFVLFLQNHDQIGNRAFGDRLAGTVSPQALEAAAALQLLSPQIPLIFMGEENASRSPFLFFTDHHGELAKAVREGRRKEFAGFSAFSDPAKRESIPDPNSVETFETSRPVPDADHGSSRAALYRRLLLLRREHLMDRLKGARSIGAEVIGSAAVLVRWRLADGATYAIATNFSAEPCALTRPAGELIYGVETAGGNLAAYTTCVFLERSRG